MIVVERECAWIVAFSLGERLPSFLVWLPNHQGQRNWTWTKRRDEATRFTRSAALPYYMAVTVLMAEELEAKISIER